MQTMESPNEVTIQQRWQLPGDIAWWFFLGAEFATLCMFFVVFAFMRKAELEHFQAAQEILDPRYALANSLVLITSGYFVARGLLSMRSGNRPVASRWMLAAALFGLLFVGIKTTEYVHKFQLGLSFSSGTFWFFYYFLTGFHFLHVLLGLGFLVWVAMQLRKPDPEEKLLPVAESCGAFWHMLDLVWIVLFPILYLL